MTCEFATNGNCQLSSDMAGMPVPLHPGACRACLLLPDAKQISNHVVTDRACWALKASGQFQKAELLRLAEHAKSLHTTARTRNGSREKEQRRQRVEEATRRKERLISWLQVFRADIDRGLGDTAARLQRQSKKSKPWIRSDASEAIRCLLAKCSCSRTDAVKRLNEQYPR